MSPIILFLEGLKHATPEGMPTELREEYERTAPNPEDWLTLIAKVRKQAAEFEGWRPEDIRSINAPALVMVGDADIVCPEYTVQLFRLLPHAQLAVLPCTNHGMRLQSPDLPLAIIEEFLDAPIPKAK